MGERARNTIHPVYPETADAISTIPARGENRVAEIAEIADASCWFILFILCISVGF
jgi:hypothetical protein